MKKVITLTLNPSLDATIITNHLNIGYYNHVEEAKHLDASGRGVNVSRALARLNTQTHAFVTLGDDAISRAYRGLIDNEVFQSTILHYAGRTRSDTIILDKSEQTETHIIDEDSIGPRHDMAGIFEGLNKIIQEGDIVVLAGMLPRDSSTAIYAQLVKKLQERGVKTALMTGGEPLKRALTFAPDIVALSQLEVEALLNYPVRHVNDMISAARKIQEQGCHQVLLIMSDYTGIVLLADNEVWTATVGEMDFRGTDSGVIDACLAGYLTGLLNNASYDDALVLGSSALLFAALQIGNEFGNTDQVNGLREKVFIARVNSETVAGE